MNFREYLAITNIVRSQHGEFEVCDSNALMYPIAIATLSLYVLWMIVRWLRQPPSASAVEFAQQYTQALQQHAHKAALYLHLLDLIVVVDPLGIGERYIIKEKFRKAVKEIPVDLGLGREEGIAVEDWAEDCWDTYVIGAEQSLPKDLYKQRCIKVDNPADGEDEGDGSESDESVGEEGDGQESCSSNTNVRTAAFVWDWKSDVLDEWPSFCDVIQAGGASFTKEEARSLSIFDDGSVGISDLIHPLQKKANASGYTIISTHDSDGDAFLFIRISDIPAAQAVLNSLFPRPQNIKRGRLFGGNRIVMPGESYYYPGLTFEAAEQENKRASNSFDRVIARCVPMPLIFAGFGAGAVATLFFSTCALGWACKNSAVIAGIAWIVVAAISALCNCILIPVFPTVLVSLIALALFHVVQSILNCCCSCRQTTEADQKRNRTRGRPEGVPTPSELLQL